MLNERLAFVDWAFASISDQWTDGKLSSLVEIAAAFSEKYEYNPELQKSVMESLL